MGDDHEMGEEAPLVDDHDMGEESSTDGRKGKKRKMVEEERDAVCNSRKVCNLSPRWIHKWC